jgi:UPF0755 protein
VKNALDVMKFITGGLFNIALALAVTVGVYVSAAKAYDYGKGLLVDDASDRPSKEIVINIADGGDTAAVARALKSEGLIKNALVFQLQSRLNGSYRFFRDGAFTLNQNMSSGEIMVALQSVQFAAREEGQVRIVEGLSNKQIAAFAESEGLWPAQEFLDACAAFDAPYDFLSDEPGAGRLEGFLFPDTYNLPPNPDPEDLIIRMLNRFETVFDADMRDKAAELGLTPRDAVTMASIIEKEIKRPEERELCSSVIYNRLNAGMPLQMCSTVLYALDKRKVSLTDEDLLVDSPYNTYRSGGLPAGPICNPGAAAISAALNPEDTDYIFFVVKDEETGEHFFTSSNDEFLSAKAAYNQKY